MKVTEQQVDQAWRFQQEKHTDRFPWEKFSKAELREIFEAAGRAGKT